LTDADMPSDIPPNLIADYQVANYEIGEGAQRFVMKVDQRSEELALLYRDRRISRAAYITACNPYSVKHTPAENDAAHGALLRELHTRSVEWIASVSKAPDGSHPEKGVLALGLELEVAKAIGEQFRQNAIVWAGEDATPGLVLLR
jgi:hypothetical protein